MEWTLGKDTMVRYNQGDRVPYLQTMTVVSSFWVVFLTSIVDFYLFLMPVESYGFVSTLGSIKIYYNHCIIISPQKWVMTITS